MRQERRRSHHRARWAAALLAALLVGCSSDRQQLGNPEQAYAAAIADAAVATPEKVNVLLPIPPDDSVNVVSWMVEGQAPCPLDKPQCSFTVGGDDWLRVTLSGEVQGLCRVWSLSGDPLRRRLEQLLGLPPDPPSQYQKGVFVVMQVPRDRLERPCLGMTGADPAQPKCTISVPGQNDGTSQASSPAMQGFIGRQMIGSYVVRSPKGPGYPFTRLGYAYDWGPGAEAHNHYGATELLIAPDTEVKVVLESRTDDYCGAAKAN